MHTWVGLFAITFLASMVQASDKNTLRAYVQKFENCAKIAGVEGGTCPDLKVDLDVSGCGDPRKVVATKIKCDGETATAFYQSAKFDYLIRLQPKRNWWGRREWEPEGHIVRTRRRPARAMAPASPPTPPTTNTPPVEALLEMPHASPEAIAAEVASDEKAERLLEFLTNLTVKGSIDLYYTANLNRPPPVTKVPTASANQAQNTYRVFDVYHDSIQLSYAHLYIQKPAEPVGVTVDLAYGPAMQTVSGTLTDAGQTGLKQAVVSYKFESGLLLEAGRFVTHIGYEVIEAQDNWNYSRGLLFGYFDPFWHQGVKVTYPFRDDVSVTGLLVNGWNNSYEFNGNKNVGLQITWMVAENTSACFNVLTGQEPAAPGQVGGERKSIYDFVGTFKASEDLTLALNIDHLTYAAPAGAQAATGVAVYAKYEFGDGWAVSPRAEYVDDKDNLAFGGSFAGGQMLVGYTLTVENKLTENILWRIEGRTDRSSKSPFVGDGGAVAASQETVTTALIGSF